MYSLTKCFTTIFRLSIGVWNCENFIISILFNQTISAEIEKRWR